jgi:hypothetical protein
MTHTHRVRLGLVAVGTLIAFLGTIQPGHSQPPRPGGIHGGPPFGPPSMPGQPGGIGGMPGRPPGFPNIPGPPTMPGGGIRGGPPIGGGQTQWRCGRCGMVLATGPQPPGQIVCPRCQTTNVPPGTPILPPGGFGPPPGNFPAPPTVPPVPFQPGAGDDAIPNPVAPFGPQPALNPLPVPPGDVFVPQDSSASAKASRDLAVRVILITLGVLLLLAVGVAGVVFALVKNSQTNKRRHRPRRRRVRSSRYDDDDDD